MAKKATSNDEGKPSLVFSLSVLRAALAFVGQAIGKNPIVPVLENVKIYAHEGRARLTSSNLQTTLSIEVDCDVVKGHPDGELLLMPFQLLTQTVAALTSPNLVLIIDRDTYGHTIKSGNGLYKMAGENPIDYPKSVTITKVVELNLTDAFPAGLAQALTNTAYAVSKDDLRPATTGVNLSLDSDELVLAATNFHVLVRSRINTSGVELPEKLNMILPGSVARILARLIDERPDDAAVLIQASMANVVVTVGNKSITARLIDERFPDYNSVIPTDNDKILVIDRLMLMDAIKRILLFANKQTHWIRLSLGDTQLGISAEDLDYSHEGNESVDCQYSGEAMEIGFDAKLLLNALSHIDADKIELHGSRPNRAMVVFRKTEDGIIDRNHQTVVMPSLLNAHA